MAVAEHPIIFTGHSIRSIQQELKTQTRRLVQLPKSECEEWGVGGAQDAYHAVMSDNRSSAFMLVAGDHGYALAPCPYGKPGDILWVKEQIYYDLPPWCDGGKLGSLKAKPKDFDPLALYYRADGECCDQIPECSCAEVGKPKWRSPRFMPKWAARIKLKVEDVRIERVQQITRADVVAEGVVIPVTANNNYALRITGKFPPVSYLEPGRLADGKPPLSADEIATIEYASAWDSINAKRAPWIDNPWVFAVTFSLVKEK